MTARTHLLGGKVAAAVYVAAALQPGSNTPPAAALLAGVPICLLGSLLPDADLPDSAIGYRVKPIAWLANRVLGHRTFFHSPLFLFLVWAALSQSAELRTWVARPLLYGMFSHLLLDALNQAGIPLFWPVRKRFSLANITIRSRGESMLALALGVAGVCFTVFSTWAVMNVYIFN